MNINDTIKSLYISDKAQAIALLSTIYQGDQASIDTFIEEVEKEQKSLISKEVEDKIKTSLDAIMPSIVNDQIRPVVNGEITNLSSINISVFLSTKTVKVMAKTVVDGQETETEIDQKVPCLDYKVSIVHKDSLVHKAVQKAIDAGNAVPKDSTDKADKTPAPEGWKFWSEITNQFTNWTKAHEGKSINKKPLAESFKSKGYVDENWKITSAGQQYDANYTNQ